MNVSTSYRVGAVAGPVVAAAMLLGACGGGDSSAATASTIAVLGTGSTSYETIAPATTAPTPENEPEDSVSDEEPEETASVSGSPSDYVVKAGDTPNGVAQQFGVTFQELQDANPSVDLVNSFPIGATIKIPGGGSSSGSSDSGSDDSSDSESSDSSADGGDSNESGSTDDGDTGEAIPDPGDDCDSGSYVIKSGDFPNAVARQFGVSTEALQAANQSIDFANSFPIGTELVIPAKDDC